MVFAKDDFLHKGIQKKKMFSEIFTKIAKLTERKVGCVKQHGGL